MTNTIFDPFPSSPLLHCSCTSRIPLRAPFCDSHRIDFYSLQIFDPLVLASAEFVKDRKLTGYWNIQSDLTNAGAQVLEEPVVMDGSLITTRHPIDVADFSVAVKNWLITH